VTGPAPRSSWAVRDTQAVHAVTTAVRCVSLRFISGARCVCDLARVPHGFNVERPEQVNGEVSLLVPLIERITKCVVHRSPAEQFLGRDTPALTTGSLACNVVTVEDRGRALDQCGAHALTG
jgi:hypothetical protein